MAGTGVRIFLARHGETVFNVEGRWQGHSDSPLTERGLRQARELARALADEPIAAVFSSDLGRAMGTARAVADAHGLDVTPDARLRELNTGHWTRKSRAEIELEYPGLQKAWATRPAGLRLPGGETILEAQARALAFVAEHMPDHIGQAVLVITHGAIGQSILVNAMGGTVEDLWLDEHLDNCQISRLRWTATEGLELIELADVRHLNEVGSLRRWRTHDNPA
jgi:probable phosphoglycerate mutase